MENGPNGLRWRRPLFNQAEVKGIPVNFVFTRFYSRHNHQHHIQDAQYCKQKESDEDHYQYPADDTGKDDRNLKIQGFFCISLHERGFVFLYQVDYQRPEDTDARYYRQQVGEEAKYPVIAGRREKRVFVSHESIV